LSGKKISINAKNDMRHFNKLSHYKKEINIIELVEIKINFFHVSSFIYDTCAFLDTAISFHTISGMANLASTSPGC